MMTPDGISEYLATHAAKRRREAAVHRMGRRDEAPRGSSRSQPSPLGALRGAVIAVVTRPSRP